jgi:hypothetical protein
LLEKNKIEKNPGRRQVAKLKANSLWGYFALNTNKVMFKIITDPTEWFQLLQNDRYIIHDVNLSNNNFIQVQYSEAKQMHFGGLTTNVVIASFVTCQARLKLFHYMQKLDKRVLYCDTDSIIFISRENEYEPELGSFLGQFTSEIKAPSSYITEFVSAGPKNYAIKTDTGETDCTVKGITFNYLTSLEITFDSLKNIVCCERDKVITVLQEKFIRNRDKFEIHTETQKKQYRYYFDKRVVFNDFTTLPFGF